MVLYIFNCKPQFPIICDVDGYVIAAKSEKSFEKYIARAPLKPDSFYPVIDCNGRSWRFYGDRDVISPITFKRRWSKKEVIAVFNNRINFSNEKRLYSEKSLSSKRYDRIFREIVDLILSELKQSS